MGRQAQQRQRRRRQAHGGVGSSRACPDTHPPLRRLGSQPGQPAQRRHPPTPNARPYTASPHAHTRTRTRTHAHTCTHLVRERQVPAVARQRCGRAVVSVVAARHLGALGHQLPVLVHGAHQLQHQRVLNLPVWRGSTGRAGCQCGWGWGVGGGWGEGRGGEAPVCGTRAGVQRRVRGAEGRRGMACSGDRTAHEGMHAQPEPGG